MTKEVFVSTDVETDGPIPGPNSMLSFAAVAFAEDGKQISSFSRNLNTLDDASGDPDTMDWWKTQPDAWAAHRLGTVSPKQAMFDFLNWCESLPGQPVFVGYPAGFDFLFIYWYLIFFCKKSPFSFSALDIKTYASAVMKTPYRKSTKKNMPRHWFSKAPHTHVALDDAMEQGILFMNMRKENLST